MLMKHTLKLSEIKQHLKDGTQDDYIWIERNTHAFPVYIKDKRIVKYAYNITTLIENHGNS